MSQSTQISLDKLINKLMPEGKGDTWAFFRVGDVWYKNGKELINIENKIAGSGLVNLGTIINTIKRIHQILNSGYANNPTKLKNKLIDFLTKQKRWSFCKIALISIFFYKFFYFFDRILPHFVYFDNFLLCKFLF